MEDDHDWKTTWFDLPQTVNLWFEDQTKHYKCFKKITSNVKHEISQQIHVWFQIYANVTKTNVSNENVLQLKRNPNWRQPEMEVNLKYKKGIIPANIGQISPNFYTKAYVNNLKC